MIEVKNLTKKYGSKKAVDNISFSVKPGEILGFLGPNGAGKTTTMNMITGYISSTEGSITVDGAEIFDDPIAVKSHIGYLPEQPPLYLDMTVKEYLGFMFDLKKVKLPRKAHLAEVSELVGISHVFERIIGNLSKGYRQRVGLAQALLGNPKVLILDEPTVGLDPNQIIEIRNLIKSLGKKHTIILSSHILPEVQATCERVIVINQGVIIADDTPDNLAKSMSSDHRLVVRVEGPEDKIFALLGELPNVQEVHKLGKREGFAYEFSIEATPDKDIRRDLFERLADRKWPILALKSSELTLEDIFLKLISGNAMQLHEDMKALSEGTEGAVPEDIPSKEVAVEATSSKKDKKAAKALASKEEAKAKKDAKATETDETSSLKEDTKATEEKPAKDEKIVEEIAPDTVEETIVETIVEVTEEITKDSKGGEKE